MKTNKINEFNIIFVNIQIISTIASIVSFIMYLFNSKMLPIMCFCFAVNLFILAFNNYKIFHKKNYTIIYLISGIILVIFGIIKIIGG